MLRLTRLDSFRCSWLRLRWRIPDRLKGTGEQVIRNPLTRAFCRRTQVPAPQSHENAPLQGTEYQWLCPSALSFGLVLSIRILDRIRGYLHCEKSRGVDLGVSSGRRNAAPASPSRDHREGRGRSVGDGRGLAGRASALARAVSEPFGHKARRQICPLYVAGLIGPGERTGALFSYEVGTAGTGGTTGERRIGARGPGVRGPGVRGRVLYERRRARGEAEGDGGTGGPSPLAHWRSPLYWGARNGALGQAPAWGSVSSVNDAREMQKTASVGRRCFTDPATRDPVPLMLWGQKLWRRTPLQTHRRRRRNWAAVTISAPSARKWTDPGSWSERRHIIKLFVGVVSLICALACTQTPSKLNRPRRMKSSSATSPRGTRSTCLYSPC